MAKRLNYFIPYMRQGMATLLDHTQQEGKRITIPINLDLIAENKESQEVLHQTELGKAVTLLGPGDVMGIDQRGIVRTEPAADSLTFEPALIPFIEFADPDFLWRFSTKKSTDGKHWIPWLSLIILKQKGDDEPGEFIHVKNQNPELPSQIQLEGNAILPDLKESWRWAHIHTEDLEGVSFEQLKNKIQKFPNKAVCRLLSPRRLKPVTRYSAFIVPTYKIGMDAALGIDAAQDRRVLSWDSPIEMQGQTLAYYYHWEFRTDTKGDFEYLVELLQPRKLSGLGTQPIDCSNPGYGMKQDELVLQLEGALKSLETEYQEWGMDGPNYPYETQQRLTDLLNSRVEEVLDDEKILRVTPPVYGEFYTEIEGETARLDASKRKWLEELNLDFRHRAAAGLGVQFIKENQETLMKSVWQQLRKVKEVNRQLNLARFGRQLSQGMYKRLEKMDGESLLKLALPLQSKITAPEDPNSTGGNASPVTMRANLINSNVSNNQAKVKVKKFLFRRGFSAQSGNTTQVSSFSPIERRGIVAPFFKLQGLVTHHAPGTTQIQNQNPNYFQELGQAAKAQLNPTLTIGKKFAERITSFRALESTQQPVLSNEEKDQLRPVMWYPEIHQPMYRYLRDLSKEYILPGLESIPPNTVGLLSTNRRFMEAFMLGLNHEFASELRWREFPTDMKGSYFRKFWDTSIYSVDDQERLLFRQSPIGTSFFSTINAKYQNRYNTWDKIEATYTNGDPEVEEQEVAKAYEEAIENWLLSREEEKDIQPLNKWKKNSRLGTHPIGNTQNGAGEIPEQLVLLVRGELLQKFSNTLIYLVKKTATIPPKPDYQGTAARIFPVFEGALPPDLVFIGFPVTEADAANYFVVFEERMTDLRFGLDVLDNTAPEDLPGIPLQDFSWQHFPEVEEGDYLNQQHPVINAIGSGDWEDPAFIATAFIQKQIRAAVELERLIPQTPE